MTQETQMSKNTILDAFLKQRAKRQNSAAIEARRLVNLYRQLPLFGDDFLDKYNAMLMAATPEVQMVLPDIIGGAVVRQYLEFLKGRAKQNDATDVISEEAAVDAYQYRHAESYLPTPDEVAPFTIDTSGHQTNVGGNNAVDTQTLSAQINAFERALEQQNAFLVQALTQLQQNMSAQYPIATDGQPVDMTTFNQKQKEILSELLTQQNEQMKANINTILTQTQELSARQMETVEKLIQKQAVPDPYAVIEEDIPVLSQTKQAPQRTPGITRYRSELHQTEVELEPVVKHVSEKSRYDEPIRPERHSSISLDDYYEEQDEPRLETKTSPDWKG